MINFAFNNTVHYNVDVERHCSIYGGTITIYILTNSSTIFRYFYENLHTMYTNMHVQQHTYRQT